MNRILKSLFTYMRMGYLLHLVTFIELVLVSSLFLFWLEDWNALRIVMICFLACLPLFPQLDARSRFQNYKLAKDQLYMFGFQERIMKPFIKSRCQRDAVLQACKELGFEDPCTAYFRCAGYRWYHLFPDLLYRNPKLIFTKAFVKTTFFAKTYKSRFDFHNLQNKDEGREQAVTRLIVKRRKRVTV